MAVQIYHIAWKEIMAKPIITPFNRSLFCMSFSSLRLGKLFSFMLYRWLIAAFRHFLHYAVVYFRDTYEDGCITGFRSRLLQKEQLKQ